MQRPPGEKQHAHGQDQHPFDQKKQTMLGNFWQAARLRTFSFSSLSCGSKRDYIAKESSPFSSCGSSMALFLPPLFFTMFPSAPVLQIPHLNLHNPHLLKLHNRPMMVSLSSQAHYIPASLCSPSMSLFTLPQRDADIGREHADFRLEDVALGHNTASYHILAKYEELEHKINELVNLGVIKESLSF
ncbi:hypothetical protein CRG98_030876 [Punica granatum]|uniref:Uncharacterized protein n=1 Tax=Punica granatum TaxID=22663 RepID=A0A2I0IXS4_PUNGR|nr:hypothetical protein CRG98_030876 [Punica granatum]